MTNLARQKTIALATNKATRLALIGFIFACALAYVYFANKMVYTLTLVEKSKQEIQSLNVEVSEVEGKRLLADNKINAETARNLGLVEASAKTFIVNKSQKTAFSFEMN